MRMIITITQKRLYVNLMYICSEPKCIRIFMLPTHMNAQNKNIRGKT